MVILIVFVFQILCVCVKSKELWNVGIFLRSVVGGERGGETYRLQQQEGGQAGKAKGARFSSPLTPNCHASRTHHDTTYDKAATQ